MRNNVNEEGKILFIFNILKTKLLVFFYQSRDSSKSKHSSKVCFFFVFLISYLISTCFFQDDHRDEKHRRKSKDYGATVDDHEVPSSRHRDVLMI